MPLAAYGLLAVFTAMALAAGMLSARVVGPRRPWTPIVPVVAAFASLYLVGHRLAVSVGPQVRLFGFDVSLPFDAATALVASFAAATLQALAARLFEPQERGTGGNRLA
jgi:hypothetical protein